VLQGALFVRLSSREMLRHVHISPFAIDAIFDRLGAILEHVSTNAAALDHTCCVNVFADNGELVGTINNTWHFGSLLGGF